MPSKQPPRPASPLDLELPNGQRDLLEYVGPSMQGWIFRSRRDRAVYRILPIREDGPPCLDDAPLVRRHEIRVWAAPSRPRLPGLAPIVQAEPCTLGGLPYFVVRYEIDPEYSLQDALREPDCGVRLGYALRVLRALPAWWEKLYAGLLPMPADIFYAEDDPWLLPLPLRTDPHLPDAEVVLTEPERVWYLAPELVRGQTSRVSGDNLDRYALGVALWQCFHRLPEARGSCAEPALQVLRQAVHGLNLHPTPQSWEMPFWLERLEATQEVIEQLRKLLALDPLVRATQSPRPLAEYLVRRRELMDPVSAVKWLLGTNKSREAHDLLQDVLLDRESYDLLLLAGDIAGAYLHRSLEAGELYEKAIEKSPDQLEAYERQLTALLQGFKTLLEVINRLAIRGQDVGELNKSLTLLDARIQRDFDRLPTVLQERREAAVARYYIRRGQQVKALQFTYPRLVPAQPEVWWKFDLALAYVEAYRDLARADRRQLQPALQQVRFTMAKLHEAATAGQAANSLDALRDYGRLLDRIEQELLALDPHEGNR